MIRVFVGGSFREEHTPMDQQCRLSATVTEPSIHPASKGTETPTATVWIYPDQSSSVASDGLSPRFLLYLPCPPILFHIEPILQRHPQSCSNAHKYRSCQTLVPARGPKNEPLGAKVPHGNHVGQHGQLVYAGNFDVVGSIQAHDALQEGPGTEGAAMQGRGFARVLVAGRRLDAVRTRRQIDLRGEVKRAVGLENVADSSNADLSILLVHRTGVLSSSEGRWC